MAKKEILNQMRWIGTVAKDLLDHEEEAVLFSIISRGIFLKFNNDKMVFLSFENYRGPITANLSLDKQALSGLHQGDRIEFSNGNLWLPNSDVSISIENAAIWNTSQLGDQPLSDHNRKKLIREFASVICQHIQPGSNSIIHPILLDYSKGKNNAPDKNTSILTRTANIRDHLKHGEFSLLLSDLQYFLGLGNGLTPSGDDFILGFFLSLNRWESVLHPEIDLKALNQLIIEAAFKQTTMISANLIECACSGLADERLIKAVDYLAAGKHPLPEVLEGILSWGNTSGVDALVGMITAFLL